MNSRRNFLQKLATVPLLGWVLTRPSKEIPLEPVKIISYGWTEDKYLSDVYKGRIFIYGETVTSGDLVALSATGEVVRANSPNTLIGIATVDGQLGRQAQDEILVKGGANVRFA